MSRFFKKITRPLVVSLIVFNGLAAGVVAGSLTPSGAVSATMHSLDELYSSIAGTFSSSSITSNQNGSLMQNLKYIEHNLVWASGSNNIWNLNSGNVGIGTSSPATKFELTGGDASISNTFYVDAADHFVGIGTSSPQDALELYDGNILIDGQSQPRISFNSNVLTSKRWDITNEGNVNRLRFMYSNGADGGNATYSMVLTGTGNVGIGGVQTPVARLDVLGSAGFDLFNVSSISGGGTSVFIIKKSGNVGIGTITPAAQLSVVAPNVATNGNIVNIASSSVTRTLNFLTIASSGFTTLDGAATNPRSVAETRGKTAGTTLDGISSIYISGKYAYTANSNRNGIAVIDLTKPSSPSFMAETRGPTPGTTLGSAIGIFVSGRYAYVANNFRDSLAIIDISNPASPSFLAETRGPTPGTSLDGARSVVVSGRYAYVTAENRASLAVIDVSNPASPSFVTETRGSTPGTTLDGARGLYISGHYAYVANNTRDSLAVIDISNPASPSYIAETQGTTPGTTLDGAFGVTISGRYAYVTSQNDNSLSVIDVFDPRTPTFITQTKGPVPGTTLSNARQVAIATHYAYVTSNGNSSLVVLDISNPASPSFVSQTRGSSPGTTLGGANPIFISGRYAYIGATTRDGFEVVDIGSLTAPQVVAGTLNADNLNVFNTANFDGGILTKGGLTIGDGAMIGGNFSVTGSSSLFMGSVGIGLTHTLPGRLSVVGSAGNYDMFDVASSSNTSVFRISKSGNVGIGTKNLDALFEIKGNNMTTSSVASISGTALTAGGSIFNITVPVSSSLNNPHGFMLIKDTTGGVLASWSMGGSLALRGNVFVHGAVTTCVTVNNPTVHCQDYAESYPTTDPTISAGEVVSIDPANSAHVIRSDYQLRPTSYAFGIVSTNPAALIDDNSFKSGSVAQGDSGTVPIALAGRVPVKISTENGPIAPGDHLIVSATKPGYAMKQTIAGTSIGIALESSDQVANGLASSLLAFVDTSYWAPEMPEQVTTTDHETLFTAFVEYLKNVIVTVKELVAGQVTTKTLCLDDVCITRDQLQEILQRGRIQAAVTPPPSDTPSPSASPSDTPIPSVSDTPAPVESIVADTPTPTPMDIPMETSP